MSKSDTNLERSLRRAVEQKYSAGKQEEISVNAIRRASERELRLDEGFYVNGGEWGEGKVDWKTESKRVIKDEVVRLLRPVLPVACYTTRGS